MIKNRVTFNVAEETLAGMILNDGDSSILPEFIFFHGAGSGVKERVYNLAGPIIKNGINMLTFDFSGHGESSGVLREGSLKKRVTQARAAIDLFAAKKPLVVCGASMGGYIAIKILELYNVQTLILFCPALYDDRAYTMRFDQGFTEIIRSPESWRNSSLLKTLEAFTGKLLVIMGDKDDVIPAGVIELIFKHTPHVSKKELYMIPDCPHRISSWISDKPDELAKLQQKILAFLE